MCKMKILIVAPYVTFPDEPGANRFIAIANLLKTKYDVTLLTSKFCHFTKTHRNKEPDLDDIKVVLIDEPGYVKNVSFSRLYSHYIFCKKFKEFILENVEHFDLVYSAYPLIRTNFILGSLKDKLNFKLVIDVQDVWPEAISGAIPMVSTTIGKVLMLPITNYANKTYAYADGLVAVSETYMRRANIVNLPSSYKEVVYIGADTLHFKNESIFGDKLVVTYIGTMSGSYDLETVVKASILCKNFVKIRFIGTGPDEDRLKKLNLEIGGNVEFLGTMPYKDAMETLKLSDIAINPIKSTAQQSITNKLSDYFCCGLPILSCQENVEVRELLALGGGINYDAGDPESLVERLSYLQYNQNLLIEMSAINKKIAQSLFLRDVSYMRILKLIDNVLY